MRVDSIRAFVDRDWPAVERLDRRHWAREFRDKGSAATLKASQALWLHMRQVRPDWPGTAERDEDLAHHIALNEMLRRVANGLATG
jgi:hypothetical protein